MSYKYLTVIFHIKECRTECITNLYRKSNLFEYEFECLTKDRL